MSQAPDTVAITGGTQNIGLECARSLVGGGHRVVVLGRDPDRGRAAVRTLGDHASFSACDVRNAAAVVTTFEKIGPLAGLVCCAGVGGRKGGDGPVHLCTPTAWDRTLAVNLTGAFHAMHAAIPRMRAGGAIVAISSIAAFRGTDRSFGAHAYAASKAGLIGLTRAVAMQYATDGIRANVVAPGPVEPGLRPSTAKAGYANGWAGDVAAAVTFLLSPDSCHINGIVLTVDGGLHGRLVPFDPSTPQ